MTKTEIKATYTEFADVDPEIGEWDDYDAQIERLDECYTRACEGTPYTIVARRARSGEAQGLYAETPRGDQILGGTIPVPEDVEEIRRNAFEAFSSES